MSQNTMVTERSGLPAEIEILHAKIIECARASAGYFRNKDYVAVPFLALVGYCEQLERLEISLQLEIGRDCA